MPIIYDTAPVKHPKSHQQVSKYLDLTKFLSLLVNKSLFFCRLDNLEDQFEGTTAKHNEQLRLEFYKQTNHLSNRPLTLEEMKEKVRIQYDFEKKVKEVTCVCCWNKSNKESAALWKIYSDYGKGIMIKTTTDKIDKSFINTQEEIRISEVSYIDYETDVMNDGNTFYPIIHKQNAYEYEEEVRLIYQVDNAQIGKNFNWSNEEYQMGKMLKVDLDCLIDEIIIGPFSPSWMPKLVIDLLEKYGLQKPVRNSKLTFKNT